MHKTTHAKIKINDAGETEVRQLNVVRESQPGRRHSLPNVDVSQAVERIDEAESAPPTKEEIQAAAQKLLAWSRLARTKFLGDALWDAADMLQKIVDCWVDQEPKRPA